mmetsp:Transcript_56274/g.110943  ORF Transcript_56274/g.110943 Transcript_56274/m.110943 type:complete len:285 (+) Transcript_56274:124-978(+)
MAASTSVAGLAMCSASKVQLPPNQVLFAYGIFLALAAAMYHSVAEGEFSALLTLSVMVQCLAVALLGLSSLISGGVNGISARSLGLEALALCCRLSSTTWLNGYLPVDASGDWVFQAFDFLSLIMVFTLLHRVLHVKRDTYEGTEDSLPVMHMIFACFLGAALLHADLNQRPLFDALWMAGLFLGAVAVLPQLWLISRSGGRVEALMSHHIAMMALSRILSGIFMWYASNDIPCRPWVDGIQHASLAILGAHFVHMVLLGDFGYYYLKGIARAGLGCAVDIEIV